MSAVTQAEFARLQGWDPAYVTRLKQAGRLVMTPDGKRVDVEASQARILGTQDPGRDDVRARHAKTRGKQPDTQRDVVSDEMGYQEARALKEKYAAWQAKADYEQSIGMLVPRDDVDAAMRYIGAAVRAALDALPDQTAPLVAPVTQLAEVHALLAEACRNALSAVGESLERQKAQLS